MTAEEIVVAALARGMEFSNEFPQTRSVYYRRITTRQQQLFVRASEINPDYFGVSESVNLVGGTADLSGLATQAERITGVRINNKGTSPYSSGQRVSIGTIDDLEMPLAPAATIRDYILTQRGTDLALVTSVWIDYSKRPADIEEGVDVPELPAQFHELLVIDATKSAARRTYTITADQRSAFIDLLTLEENELLADFERHVERFQLAEESRFGRTARAIVKPKGSA